MQGYLEVVEVVHHKSVRARLGELIALVRLSIGPYQSDGADKGAEVVEDGTPVPENENKTEPSVADNRQN